MRRRIPRPGATLPPCWSPDWRRTSARAVTSTSIPVRTRLCLLDARRPCDRAPCQGGWPRAEARPRLRLTGTSTVRGCRTHTRSLSSARQPYAPVRAAARQRLILRRGCERTAAATVSRLAGCGIRPRSVGRAAGRSPPAGPAFSRRKKRGLDMREPSGVTSLSARRYIHDVALGRRSRALGASGPRAQCVHTSPEASEDVNAQTGRSRTRAWPISAPVYPRQGTDCRAQSERERRATDNVAPGRRRWCAPNVRGRHVQICSRGARPRSHTPPPRRVADQHPSTRTRRYGPKRGDTDTAALQGNDSPIPCDLTALRATARDGRLGLGS